MVSLQSQQFERTAMFWHQIHARRGKIVEICRIYVEMVFCLHKGNNFVCSMDLAKIDYSIGIAAIVHRSTNRLCIVAHRMLVHMRTRKLCYRRRNCIVRTAKLTKKMVYFQMKLYFIGFLTFWQLVGCGYFPNLRHDQPETI